MEQPKTGRVRRISTTGIATALVLVLTAGIAGAAAAVRIKGQGASLQCVSGMSHLSHVFDENASVFPGDPAPQIDVVFTVEDDGFLVEEVKTGTHTSTHIDVPGHFILGGRTVDELDPQEFVWPAYVIDVRDRIAAEGGDFQLSVDDIKAYESDNGKIKHGSMVIVQTGWDAKFGTDDYVDDLAPGFSGAAVQWMFDTRGIAGVGSDTLGPDAYTDVLFDATFTALANDGVALPGLNNVDSLAIRGDLIIAPAIRLADGSGYQVAPLGCLGSAPRR